MDGRSAGPFKVFDEVQPEGPVSKYPRGIEKHFNGILTIRVRRGQNRTADKGFQSSDALRTKKEVSADHFNRKPLGRPLDNSIYRSAVVQAGGRR